MLWGFFKKVVIADNCGIYVNEIFENYKANRAETPTDLKLQFPIMREAAKALGITTIEKEGFEADDIIATIAKSAEKKGYNIEIITADKDIAQLVNNNITIYDPMKDSLFSTEKIYERFGVEPRNLRDFFALVGDSSDNIPGLPGIGPKTASRLINEHKNLDLIYENIESITPIRIQNIIKNNKELAYLSRSLVTLVDNIPIEMNFEDLGLIQPILTAIKEKGYTEPTPIQAKAIPVILERKDILGCAQTGTGKTAAFALPILQMLSKVRQQLRRHLQAHFG